MAERDLVDAVQFLIGTGTAEQLGQVLGDAIGQALAKAPQPRPTRDHLALAAMQGLLAGSTLDERNMAGFVAGLARHAYHVADAMLAYQDRCPRCGRDYRFGEEKEARLCAVCVRDVGIVDWSKAPTRED